MYRVTGRIFHLAQQLQLMNEITKHNILDVMATPDVYCQRLPVNMFFSEFSGAEHKPKTS